MGEARGLSIRQDELGPSFMQGENGLNWRGGQSEHVRTGEARREHSTSNLVGGTSNAWPNHEKADDPRQVHIILANSTVS